MKAPRTAAGMTIYNEPARAAQGIRSQEKVRMPRTRTVPTMLTVQARTMPTLSTIRMRTIRSPKCLF